MNIKELQYYPAPREIPNFEILKLDDFFSNRPKLILEKDHRLGFWTMLYIIKGEGFHSIEYNLQPYQSGDVIVIAKNFVHSFRVNHNVEGYIININEPFFFENGDSYDYDMLSFFEMPFDKPLVNVDVSKNTMSRSLIDFLYYQSQHYEKDAKKLIKSLFVSFIYSFRLENKEKIEPFNSTMYKYYYEYRNLVDKNYSSLKSVSDYVKLMGVSSKTINTSCRECSGLSAKTIITNRIIIAVKRLLIQNKLKNYEISELLGFDESANLAGFFKRYTNMSMNEFREREKTRL